MKRLKDLTPEERAEIFEHWFQHGEIEKYFPCDEFNEGWEMISSVPHEHDAVYRIPQTQDSINWDHVAPEFVAMARDDDDEAYLYKGEPDKGSSGWDSFEGYQEAIVFASYKKGTVSWENSLVLRPAKEEWRTLYDEEIIQKGDIWKEGDVTFTVSSDWCFCGFKVKDVEFDFQRKVRS